MQNSYIELLKVISLNAEKSNPENEGDYQKDGLLYCRKCHTAKQCKISYEGESLTVACMCACKEQDIKSGKAAEDRIKRDEYICHLKQEAFPDPVMREWTFGNSDSDTLIMATAKSYVDNFASFKGKGVLYYGTVGTGKTYAAVCIANALLDKGMPCLVTSLTRLYNEQQENLNERQRYLDRLSKYTLLILDDYGSERNTDTMNELVHGVIDARCNSGLPLIVTTNLKLSDFKTATAEKQRIYSRLYKACAFVEAVGDDRRAKEYKETVESVKARLGVTR